jgi:PhzF family phenazine biosynthesis protein
MTTATPTFQHLSPSDLHAAIAIELASYPSDEAASLQSLTHRQQVAPMAFLGMYDHDHTLIGFICSTCTNAPQLEEETMSTHDPTGVSLCIHSVVVKESHRRQGLATLMLRHYCTTVPYHFPLVKNMRLISKAHLISFYAQASGFDFVQLWPFHHGQDHWFEMQLSLDRIVQYQVDAFAVPTKAFSGNPAAVALLPPGMPRPSDEWYKNVAAANALSETAFVQRRREQPSGASSVAYDLRWFTPTTEVDLCGHATLATAFALWESKQVLRDAVVAQPVTTLHFHTLRSGVLIATQNGNGAITMDFPSDPSTEVPPEELVAIMPMVVQGMGLTSDQDVLAVHKGKYDLLVEVNRETFGIIVPNFSVLTHVPCRGVVVTCVGNGGDVSFQSRWFGPQSGVPEDPVTGSAHCMLACYWQQKLNTNAMVGHQASERSGTVGVELSEDGTRVSLTGCSRFFSRGVLEK